MEEGRLSVLVVCCFGYVLCLDLESLFRFGRSWESKKLSSWLSKYDLTDRVWPVLPVVHFHLVLASV